MKTVNIHQNNPSDVWEWVKYYLALKGYTFGKLALIHKIKKTNFTNVKRVHSPKYELILANYVGCAPRDLWPDRYKKHTKFVEHQPQEINGKVIEGK